MRLWNCAAIAALLTAGLPAPAPAQPEAVEPTVEVRLRSVNDLLDTADYLGVVFDKGEQVAQARQFLKQLSADDTGLQGVDPKRPFGAYAVFSTDVASSPVVGMVPIADRAKFLAALKEHLAVAPEKAEGGTLKAFVPSIGETYLRFADDYLYVARVAGHLDVKKLVDPKTFFARDDGAVASAVVHFDRVPADLKTFIAGQLEHQILERLKANEGTKTAAQTKFERLLGDAFVGSAKTLGDDGKALTVRVVAAPKTDDLTAEVVLTAKPGSPLAKTLAGVGTATSVPAGIVAPKDAVIRFGTKVELPEALKKRLGAVIDDLVDDAVKQAGDRDAAQRIADPLAATAKAGILDAAVALAGPDATGRHALLAAVGVKEGKEIEKLVRFFGQFLPGDQAEGTFDVEKVGAFALHKIELKRTSAESDRVFGEKAVVWLATSEDYFALSIEPDGALLKAGLKAKPVAVPVVGAEAALAKAVPAFEKDLKPDEVKAVLKDAFGDESPVGKDALALTVEGGQQLTARLKVKGKALRLLAALGEFKKK